MKVGDGFHLTYCSNIHPGETWEAIDNALRTSLPRIREILGYRDAMAVGLRLSAAAAADLEQHAVLDLFREFLREGNYYVFTINGFPYGAFHGERVKERVYLPDWRTRERLEYSNSLARILAALLAERQDIEGSVSTVPGAFRAAARGGGDATTIAMNVLRHAAFLVRLGKQTGTAVALAIEPEPACLIETTDDAVEFFSKYLFDPSLVSSVSIETGTPLAVDDIRRHVGICLDACHVAVEFEDSGDVLRKLSAAGIRILKVQVSSALRLERQDAGALSRSLTRFADDTYLHQVVENSATGRIHFADLPDALAAAARDPGIHRDWRVHFHVPIFLDAMQGFETTQRDLLALLGALKREPACRYLEIETYTWDVLPPEYRTTDVCTAIARELSWARSQLEA
jgi:hypothetical protein